MQIDTLIDTLPLWSLFAATVVLVVLSVEGGYRLGSRRRRRPEREIEAPVSAILGAMLGLLAFMLAFTFGLATTRFEARRGLIVNEANAIGTAYLRAGLLPEPHRTEIRNLLRAYTDVRLEAAQPDKIELAIRRSAELHKQLWSQAVAAGEKDPHSVISGLFISSLNEVIDLHAKRVTANRNRIPGIIWAVLYLVTVLSMGTEGYYSGLSGARRLLAAPALILAFSAVILLVADLDRPLEGLLKANLQPMVDLQNSLSLQPVNRGEIMTKRPLHTYSIIARDPATGEFGAAVQSHWFAVGTLCLWVEAGVGAVATQAMVDPGYGKLGLDLMRAGKSAPDALRGLIAADEAREVRQVAMIDAQGRVVAHTGKKTISASGHRVGKDYSVQANLMLNDKVWPAMAGAFETSAGDLAERMMAALEAGQAAGGDIRGKQSAALVVVTGKPTGRPWADRIFDLRVDDHPEPLKELRRLLVLQRAYNHMNAGDAAMERKDNAKALEEYGAAARLAPDNLEILYWHAIALVNMKRIDDALPLFRKVFARDKNWVTLTPRLAEAELIPNDPALIERIRKAGDR